MFSLKNAYKIRAKVHGKGGIFSTGRLAYVPLLDWTVVTGTGRSLPVYTGYTDDTLGIH